MDGNTGIGHPRRLRREVCLLLGLKILALSAIYLAFFSPSHRTSINTQALNQHMLNLTDSEIMSKNHE